MHMAKKAPVHAKDKIFTDHAAWVKRLKKENAELRKRIDIANKQIEINKKHIKLIKELIALLE
jgi:hypothetical protein